MGSRTWRSRIAKGGTSDEIDGCDERFGIQCNYIYRLFSHGWGSIFVIDFSRHFQYTVCSNFIEWYSVHVTANYKLQEGGPRRADEKEKMVNLHVRYPSLTKPTLR